MALSGGSSYLRSPAAFSPRSSSSTSSGASSRATRSRTWRPASGSTPATRCMRWCPATVRSTCTRPSGRSRSSRRRRWGSSCGRSRSCRATSGRTRGGRLSRRDRRRARGLVRRRPATTSAAVIVLAIPIAYEIGVGNVNGLLLAAAIACWILVRDERAAVAGPLAAVMFAIKLTPLPIAAWVAGAGGRRGFEGSGGPRRGRCRQPPRRGPRCARDLPRRRADHRDRWPLDVLARWARQVARASGPDTDTGSDVAPRRRLAPRMDARASRPPGRRLLRLPSWRGRSVRPWSTSTRRRCCSRCWRRWRGRGERPGRTPSGTDFRIGDPAGGVARPRRYSRDVAQ